MKAAMYYSASPPDTNASTPDAADVARSEHCGAAKIAEIRASDHEGARHHPLVDTSEPTIILVDDLRSFVDGRAAEVARTSAAGVELLHRYRGRRLDELWLDHDLGEDAPSGRWWKSWNGPPSKLAHSTSVSSTSTPPTRPAPRRSPRCCGTGATESTSHRDRGTSATSTGPPRPGDRRSLTPNADALRRSPDRGK